MNSITQRLSALKKIRLTKNDIWALIYLSVLLIIIIDGLTKLDFGGIPGILLIVLLIIPFFMSSYFKVYNTYFLGLFVYISASTAYNSSNIQINMFSIGMTVFIFCMLLLNIIFTVIDLYQMESNNETSSFFYRITRWAFKYRFLYVVFAAFGLVVLVLLSFSAMYGDIYDINPKSFIGNFDELYLSFTTYFTIGYGDIVPNTPEARRVVMVEMLLGYFISALIIPLLIVAFGDLVRSKDKEKEN